ncbi:helix-turn-helix domain-containing protein [Streptomyces iranensis]|uniref:helix-turn-helix domain-containing protein n=1 Tax=Streptomyces iranensis TaxID=576784 RepID=UPI0035563788
MVPTRCFREGRAGAGVACRRAVWRSSPGISSRGRPRTGWTEDQVWTAARVATLISRKFHVSYSVPGATRLMRRLGFTPQMPARRVAERDEQAVTGWKEATWMEVKSGRPAGTTSALRTRRASPAGRPKDAPGAGEATPQSSPSVDDARGACRWPG